MSTQKQSARVLAAALIASLPAAVRAAEDLRHAQGCDDRIIARRLSISAPEVQAHLDLALAARKLLAAAVDDDNLDVVGHGRAAVGTWRQRIAEIRHPASALAAAPAPKAPTVRPSSEWVQMLLPYVCVRQQDAPVAPPLPPKPRAPRSTRGPRLPFEAPRSRAGHKPPVGAGATWDEVRERIIEMAMRGTPPVDIIKAIGTSPSFTYGVLNGRAPMPMGAAA